MGEALVSEKWYSVGSYGVSAGVQWATLPHYESWEHVLESFWQTLYTGNCFGFPSIGFIRCFPAEGRLQVFPAHAPEFELEFIPTSLAGLRVAITCYMRDCLDKVSPPLRPKEPAKLSAERSKVL